MLGMTTFVADVIGNTMMFREFDAQFHRNGRKDLHGFRWKDAQALVHPGRRWTNVMGRALSRLRADA